MIRKLMLDANVTGADIARLCKRHRSYVSHTIAGRMQCEVIRSAVASTLNVSYKELWG